MLINGSNNTAATIGQLMQVQQNLEPESPEALSIQQRIEMLQATQRQQTPASVMPPQTLMLLSAMVSLFSAIAQQFITQQPPQAEMSGTVQGLLSIYKNLEPESPEAQAIASQLNSFSV